jgi:hypothetical protein
VRQGTEVEVRVKASGKPEETWKSKTVPKKRTQISLVWLLIT